MRVYQRIVFLIIILILFSCVSNPIAIKSKIDNNFIGKIDNLFLLYKLGDKSEEFSPEFIKCIENNLSAAKIKFISYKFDPLELNDEGYQNKINQYHSIFLVIFEQTRGIVDDYGDLVQMTVLVTISDLSLKKDLWKGQFNIGEDDDTVDEADASEVADSLMKKWKSDKLF
jgi:hypothetical protein